MLGVCGYFLFHESENPYTSIMVCMLETVQKQNKRMKSLMQVCGTTCSADYTAINTTPHTVYHYVTAE